MSDIHEQVKQRMTGLLQGSADRGDVADWAMARIRNESADYSFDATLWTALDRLAGADLQQAPGVYLHDQEDFRAWLADFGE